MGTVYENINHVKSTIAQAAEKAGRPAGSVRLVAVTKTVPLDRAKEAIAAGITDIGENKAQEMTTKFPLLEGVTKHFIGHLQSNKVRDVVAQCDWIHSVDSAGLLEKINSVAGKLNKKINVLLEIDFYHHMADVDRTGFEPKNVQRVLKRLQEFSNISLQGLMTIPLPDLAVPEIHHVFRSLRILRDALERSHGVLLPELSMGMSEDYPIAISEGATMVRVGSAIFGKREQV